MTIAKKEYLENVRNAWVIAVSVVFLVLTLLASYFGSIIAGNIAAAPGFAHIVPTLVIMDNVSGFLVPILAITVGFGSISGERESGSLGLLVAQPVRRLDIILGKWVGLYAISTWFLSSWFAWNILTVLVVAVFVGSNAISSGSLPGWLIVTQWLNPTSAYEGLLATTIQGYTTVVAGLARSGGIALYNAPSFLVALAAWILVPFYGAYAIFQRRDV
jgi:ABC-type transport system involved in multi-copper enzyme maturation permease subunit